jgi:hypothetical protein
MSYLRILFLKFLLFVFYCQDFILYHAYYVNDKFFIHFDGSLEYWINKHLTINCGSNNNSSFGQFADAPKTVVVINALIYRVLFDPSCEDDDTTLLDNPNFFLKPSSVSSPWQSTNHDRETTDEVLIFVFWYCSLWCFFYFDCCVVLRVLQVCCVAVMCTVKNMAPSEVQFACDVIIVEFWNLSYIVPTIKCVLYL